MTRILTLAVLLCSLLPAIAAEPSGKPNFVFVLVDDLRWDDLACTGNPFVKSPNIDRIANEGARFTNAFATASLCSPSRACILTGQYSHANGIIDNTERGKQSHSLKTFPQELQKAGYETAFFGKWHMGNDSTPRPGFDKWYCLQGQGSTFDSTVNEDGNEHPTKGYVTDVLSKQCEDFIRKKHDKPFFLYVSHKAIHPEVYQGPDGKLSDPTLSNFIPAPRHKDLYAGQAIPRRPSAKVPPTDKPALQQKIGDLPPLGPETGSSDKVILNRLRMLAAVDESTGQLLKALEETGQLDNTCFVVTGDHGYFYGEHGLSVERRLAYEEAIRIPLLVRYPKMVKSGSKIEPTALTLDMAPTFVEMAGGAIPSQYQGHSLVPLLKGEKAPADWNDAFLIEFTSDIVFPRTSNMGYTAVRGGGWKYIHYKDLKDSDELYDLEEDPYELKNVINDAAAAPALEKLNAQMQRLLSQTQP